MSTPKQTIEIKCGSGPVTCECAAHRDRCRFGRPHYWAAPWYDGSGVLQYTFKCGTCGSVCLAETLEPTNGAPAASSPQDAAVVVLRATPEDADRMASAWWSQTKPDVIWADLPECVRVGYREFGLQMIRALAGETR